MKMDELLLFLEVYNVWIVGMGEELVVLVYGFGID